MDVEKIKKLREITSLGINDCKKALEESQGDLDGALKILKEKGISILEKRGARTADFGLIDAYVHFSGDLGSLVEVNCETDFVARTDVFKKFVKDLALHIAATIPLYIKREDIPEEKLKEIENLDEYAKEKCLLEQPFVRDPSKTISDYLKEIVSQTGENIVIKRFCVFSLGEDAD